MRPLSNIPNVSHVDFALWRDVDTPFEKRARLAPYCIDAVASSSQLDASLLRLFMQLMGGSQRVAARMYLSLKTRGPTNAAITAAAKSALSAWQFGVFDVITKSSKSAQGERDNLAHWVWGYSNDLPDALLLIDPQYLPLDHHPFGIGYQLNDLVDRANKIFAYEERDFRSIASKLKELARAAETFRLSLARPYQWNDSHLFSVLDEMTLLKGKFDAPA